MPLSILYLQIMQSLAFHRAANHPLKCLHKSLHPLGFLFLDKKKKKKRPSVPKGQQTLQVEDPCPDRTSCRYYKVSILPGWLTCHPPCHNPWVKSCIFKIIWDFLPPRCSWQWFRCVETPDCAELKSSRSRRAQEPRLTLIRTWKQSRASLVNTLVQESPP